MRTWLIELLLYFAITLIIGAYPLPVELKTLDDEVIAIRLRLLLIDRSRNRRRWIRRGDGPRRRE
jgi:hypothetical protein